MRYLDCWKRFVVSVRTEKWLVALVIAGAMGGGSANAGSYYVATNGKDSNPGTLAQPFRTIQKAANVMDAGDVCYIRGGVYRETVTPKNSGSEGASIRFENFRNEKVTVSGADVLNGWTSDKGAVFKAEMDWDLGRGNNQIFVNGQMMLEARWPNSSLDVSHPKKAFADWADNTSSGGIAALSDDELKEFPAGFWDGATIHVCLGPEPMVAQTGIVTWSAPGSLNFRYSSSGFTPEPGNEYYLIGKREALDTAGEWHLDAGNSTLHLWTPSGNNPERDRVEAKRRNYAFDLSSKSYISIKDIHLFAASINSNGGTANCVFDRLDVKYVSHRTVITACWGDYEGGSGLIINGKGNVLKNSRLAYSAGNGVKLLGEDSTIENCVIRDMNYGGTDCANIWTSGYRHTIKDCTIHDSGRSLLVHRGLKQSRIISNHFYNAGIQTYDLGATYTWHDDGEGTEIAYNWIHDIRHPKGKIMAGIYLDSDSSNYLLHHNVIWNVGQAIKMNAASENNLVYNNTLDAEWHSIECWPDNGSMQGSKIKNNIFRATAEIFRGAEASSNLDPSQNPMFAEDTVFQLKDASPAIDAGARLEPYTDDFTGKSPDIGAYEHNGPRWIPGVQSERN